MEIRIHGRGGQGGVTCAKLLAAVYARLGKSVQSFGDYAGERSGAPVRAYVRVSDGPITIRNKVYHPDHLLILDPGLLSPGIVSGLRPGGTLALNTAEPLAAFASRFEPFRLALVDATDIARKHHIGTSSVVIVNTTMAAAFARALDLPFAALEAAYGDLGLLDDLPAAEEAFESVAIREPQEGSLDPSPSAPSAQAEVLPLTAHLDSPPTGLQTGSWRTQSPRYVENLSPCNAACPAGNDVVGFVQALTTRGEAAAAEILGRTTPLASVCGRVCPAPCMILCNRRGYDGAVDVRGLERWVADRVPVARGPVAKASERRRIAIVGGGPAGLSAAYTIAQAGHEAILYEAEKHLGGLLRTGIPSYRLAKSALDREIEGILRLGVEVRSGIAVDPGSLEKLAAEHDAVIVCTGLQRPRSLEAPGIELRGVEQGIRFLHRLNTRRPRRIRGRVVVLGGGNTAMDCARSALRCGARSVLVAYRRTFVEMPAILEEVDEAMVEGVIFGFQRHAVAFEGERRLESLILAEVDMGPPDETGRRRPIVADRHHRIQCDHALLALGQSADWSILPEGWYLTDGQVWKEGAPIACFAAGDVATGDGTVTHAIGDGRRAAGRALARLGVPIEEFERPPAERAVPTSAIRVEAFSSKRPARARVEPPGRRVHSFEPFHRGLADASEAERCFSCGHCTHCDTCLLYCPEGVIRRGADGYEVDLTYCKGCGVCVQECPRQGMEMVPRC